MRLFHNDYNEMCHPKILAKLNAAAVEPMTSYGVDCHCENAAEMIRKLCGREDVMVHFLLGGTQTNLTVIASALRPYQAVIAPISAHINEHETGAIEATGHKIVLLPEHAGKISAAQVSKFVEEHYGGNGCAAEHMAQPKLVYISQPTELGTLYTLSELETLAVVCKNYGLYLYVDGARLGYGLAADGNDVQISDLARLCDAFYIGGTKQGTMFGEAVVITNPSIAEDFRYMIKQRGGMMAKGWLLGLQFEAMFEDGLYFQSAKQANIFSDQIRRTLRDLGYPLVVESNTNQVFTIMSDSVLDELSKEFMFTEWSRVDENHRMIRFCTSWATTQESTDLLCDKIVELSK